MPQAVQFYNTLTRQLETFAPMVPPTVKMYVCGPTVYDEAHLGHARCYMTWDILYRFLKSLGYDVVYTRNITDVDDKILNRAAENGEHPMALAERFTRRFHEVMADLNTLPPVHEPKATEYVPKMIEVIQKLLETGYAYTTPSGTVYYDTLKKQNYGNLCHQNLEDLQSGARVDVDPEKRNAVDFALWKPAPVGEPYVWEAPWGPGRPGWHIECSAMSFSLLGEQLDIHAGGMDLIFPHHQNEIAQSEAFTGTEPFVKLWMHNGFVNVSGEKMSKSLGNFSTIASLMETYDANTLRYFMLTQHYRSPMDFSDEALQGAQNRIQKIQAHVQRLVQMTQGVLPTAKLAALQAETEQRLRELLLEGQPPKHAREAFLLKWGEAMASDLNTAQALSIWNELLSVAISHITSLSSEARTMEDVQDGIKAAQKDLELFLVLGEMMGLRLMLSSSESPLEALHKDIQDLYQDVAGQAPELFPTYSASWSSKELMDNLIIARGEARKQKNWGVSDAIRNRLGDLKIQLEDAKDGTTSWVFSQV